MISVPSSYKDPSGFMFCQEGINYRQINYSYRDNYDLLMGSGLYASLVSEGLLVSHKEITVMLDAYKVIKPIQIPFISYPYEWCFSQLKNAALLTLSIQKKALEFGMSLKDASAYNIQFINGSPVFIDTLSFEKYKEGQPWVAYKQFCEHFLAPLVLMSYKDYRLSQLMKVYIDGIPLDLTSRLLPFLSRLNPLILTHIHLHAVSQRNYAGKSVKPLKLSRLGLLGIIDSLELVVKSLKLQISDSMWSNYYNDTNSCSLENKKTIVRKCLQSLKPERVWDLGANTGVFSRIAVEVGAQVVSFDNDMLATEVNYASSKGKNILPLVLDLTNPSPAVGWGCKERMSLMQRASVDTVMMLALIHHLVISNNLPFRMIAEFLYDICSSLIIEFVPKSDLQVQGLLSSREDIFIDYTEDNFEQEFSRYFSIKDKASIKESQRIMYLMVKYEN